jgi:alcohol dehydrogenase YqhD (iron-dependent ADH family)
MHNFEFILPTKIIFGGGEINRVGKEAEKLGRKPLLVTGKTSMRKLGILDRVIFLLKEEGLEVVLYDKIEPNPRVATIDEAGELAKSKKCDFVIGLGGGSPMDAAKAIAARACVDDTIWNYIYHGEGQTFKRVEKALPIMTLPTIAATGSEADNGGVITNWETHEKAVIGSPHLFPKISIVDPELTVSVPPDITSDGAVDIICHVIESYFTATSPAPLQDRLSEGIIKTVMGSLEKALSDPENIEARSNLSWCSSLALSGFVNSGRGGAMPMHAIQHAISGHYDISHGRGLALILPPIMEYTYEHRPEKYAQLAKNVFEIDTIGLPIIEGAKLGVKAMADWLRSVDMYTTFTSLGIVDPRYEQMAEDTIRIYGRKRGYLENPRRLYREDIINILKMAE